MQTTNNPLPEIGVILIALGFIAAGTTLLALGKVDLNVAMTLYILAGSVAGINVALKAPSPTQQQLLVQALASQAQPQPLQAPAPVAMPQVVPNSIDPKFGIMPPAIMTTGVMPSVPKP